MMHEDLKSQLFEDMQHLYDDLKTFRESNELVNEYASENRDLLCELITQCLTAINRLVRKHDEKYAPHTITNVDVPDHQDTLAKMHPLSQEDIDDLMKNL